MKSKWMSVLAIFCCLLLTDGLGVTKSEDEFKQLTSLVMQSITSQETRVKIGKNIGIVKDMLNKGTESTISDVLKALRKNSTLTPADLKKIDWKKLAGLLPIESIIKQMVGGMAKNFSLSPGCYGAVFKLVAPLIGIKNTTEFITILFQIPLGKIVDSWGKPPSGLLQWNGFWAGAYDECQHAEDTKYCLAGMTIGNSPAEITYGSCFPKQCSNADVKTLLVQVEKYAKGAISFSKAKQPTYCEAPVVYGTGRIATLSVIAVIVFLCILGSITEMICDCRTTKVGVYKINADEEETSSSDNIENGVIGNGSAKDVLILPPEKHLTGRDSKIKNFLLCFSMIKNTRTILATDVPPGAITSINGIRVISMFWVILGHYYLFTGMLGKLDNYQIVMTITQRASFLVVANAFVSVDTFFLLSGVLVSYLILRRMEKKNGMSWRDVALMFLHRYIRLTPSLGIVILLYTNIMPLTVSTGATGMGVHQGHMLQKPCYDYWWSTILYINNFYPDYAKQCIPWSWYLANDMQFYLLSPCIMMLMVYVEKRVRRAKLWNLILIFSFCTASFIITGIIVGVFDIPMLMIKASSPDNPRIKNAGMLTDRYYDKPYIRIPPYLVGIFLGYILSRGVTFTRDTMKKWLIIACGWSCAIAMALSVVYGPWKVFRKENQSYFNDAENITYGVFHSFAFTVAVAWVIYACQNKAAGLINDFLSWKVWIPLSRLTYGAYLIHILVYFFYFFVRERPYHYQDSIMVFDYISVTFVAYVCSFVLAVCVECPVANLEKKLFER